MKTKHWFLSIIAIFLLAIVAGLIKNNTRDGGAAQTADISNSPTNLGGNGIATVKPNNAISLITEPADGMAPALAMIKNASTSVDLVMYELEDTQVEAALAAAEARGVAVRVLLNEGYYGVPDDPENIANGPAYRYLQANGVAVRWTPAYFALTHQKTLVADGAAAAIMTFNFTSQYYATSRDFGIIDRDANDVSAIETAFDDDWQGKQIAAADASINGDDLVWSPGSKSAMLAIINGTRKSLDIYNEEMDDADITNALAAAAQRGVDVEVVMTYSSEWKTAFEKLAAAGASVRTYSSSKKAPLYIHAKMILADDNTNSNPTVFLGSENFSESSLNDNRELGLFITEPKTTAELAATFTADYQNATPFAG
jgi:cardiolipin synthase A/B